MIFSGSFFFPVSPKLLKYIADKNIFNRILKCMSNKGHGVKKQGKKIANKIVFISNFYEYLGKPTRPWEGQM